MTVTANDQGSARRTMSFALRSRRLRCFYCGEHSGHKQNGVTRQFKCEHCEAVNYLDEKGKITDPPAATTSSAVVGTQGSLRYGRHFSSNLETSASNIFCATCLKNQHLYRENLAQYLPAESSPDYHKYLAGLDTYKNKLEQRYPQVCSDCAPAARDKIRRAGYVAKTDHLRRMVERSKTKPPRARRWGWRYLLLTGAGLCSYGSTLVQFTWHGASAMATRYPSADISWSENRNLQNVAACGIQAINQTKLHPTCVSLVEAWMPYALVAGLATFWWNNKLRTRYLTTGGRLNGLLEAILLQSIALILRLASFYLRGVYKTFGVTQDAIFAMHAFMMGFIVLVSVLSYTCVHINSQPRISFTAHEILPHVPPSTNPPRAAAPQSPDSIFNTPRPYQLSSYSRNQDTFPISALASRSVAPQSPPQGISIPFTQVPTPSPQPEDPDEMDWAPSASSSFSTKFQPRSRVMPIAPSGPSPFHGHLPPAPNGTMRHPRDTTTPLRAIPFQKASTEKQKSFFQTDPATADSDAEDLETEGEDVINRAYTRTTPRQHQTPPNRKRRKSSLGITMSPARFFAPRDREKMETGLESMFDEVFCLRDEPREVEDPTTTAVPALDADGSPRAASTKRSMFDVVPREEPRAPRKLPTLLLTLLIPAAILLVATLLVKSRTGGQESGLLPG